ncbi:MAG: hypothetical protein GY777_15135 [Candidatus Brocadiaceae bacterium]|nr:hypothetical protein [Candidatus Brocadiaceae bacterium]
MRNNIRRCRDNVLSVFVKCFSIITVIAFLWHTPITNIEGNETGMGSNMMAAAKDSTSSIPDRYTNEEIDERINAVQDSIPVIPGRYTNDEIYTKDEIQEVINLSTQDAYTQEYIDKHYYTKEEVDNQIMALNETISSLKNILINMRGSIPANIDEE